MKRNFLFRFLICLVPTVLSGVFVGMAFYKESQGQPGFRRGIDLAGGTILVYEVALQPGQEGLNSDQIRELAENLKRRIDPNDLKNIIVRPVGTSRIEIILPYAASAGGKEGSTENEIQEVKNLVSQVGVLEFRILANDQDDAQAIREAQRIVEAGQTDPDAKKLLDQRAADGRPPLAPEGTFQVFGSDVSYEWLPVGKEEMESLLLERTKNGKIDVDSTGNPKMSGIWQQMRAAPGRAFLQRFGDREGRAGSYLIYSRKFAKSAPAKKEEWKVGKHEYFLLARVSPQDGLKVSRDVGLKAQVETDTRTLSPAVSFAFNGTGARRFGDMTERNKPSQTNVRTMAILMDGEVVSAPYLAAILREGGQISGPGFDMNAVKRLVRLLQSGALNAELKPDPVSENTVGPTLGQDTISKGLTAIGFAFGAVLLFMVIYYRFSGVVACIALFVNLLMTVGFMVAVNAAFTLPGLAGIVLMLGMAVDANVLIYERLREEREKGATLMAALRAGYDRAFGTIIDTHLTSIFTAIVLYTFGNDNLKGFAVSLTVGLIISLFTSLYMTRLMFDFALSRRAITELRMMRLFARPKFDFMKIRVPMFVATAVVTALGLGLFIYRGEAGLNVDFTKGTAYGGRLKDGEARALSQTSDGKLGFLDLMSEKRQAERLKVTDVVWRRPVADIDDPNAQTQQAEYIYEITYDDSDGKTSKATVTFANPPEGVDEAAQREDVMARAAALPGLSVEQVFISTDPSYGSNKSRSFTVRTTEKEPELVQIMLDRLLRDEKTGEQLMEATEVTDVQVDGSTAILTLDKPASPNYLKGFVTRELKMVGRVPALGGAPAVEVTGLPTEGETEELRAKRIEEVRSGRYQRIRVDVSKNSLFREMRAAEELSDKLGGLVGGLAGANPAAVSDMTAFESSLAAAVKSFEARPLPDRLETFDPALAADTRNKALYAVLASWLAILAYLWFRFGSWTFGLAAVFCLIHDLCFTLGCIALCHYLHDTTFGRLLGLSDFKIDLTAVAALLTLVGYSVSDTIVVFDRIKEVRGKNPGLTTQMINDSINGTLSRTVLASLTTFLVVGVLYIFGGEGVHLFAFTMVIGIIVGTYSSIYIASPLLLMFGEGHGKKAERAPVKPLEATIG